MILQIVSTVLTAATPQQDGGTGTLASGLGATNKIGTQKPVGGTTRIPVQGPHHHPIYRYCKSIVLNENKICMKKNDFNLESLHLQCITQNNTKCDVNIQNKFFQKKTIINKL